MHEESLMCKTGPDHWSEVTELEQTLSDRLQYVTALEQQLAKAYEKLCLAFLP